MEYINDDWREMRVSMKVRWYNRNYFGTHFGGSLYSMVDPHICLMLTELMGRGYFVWDKAADIDFIKATKNPISATFTVTDSQLAAIKEATEGGEKYLPEFEVDIIDSEGELVAKVNKTLYVRKKKPKS